MTNDLKKMYRTVMDDNFPPEITISFGDQVLIRPKLVPRLSKLKFSATILA